MVINITFSYFIYIMNKLLKYTLVGLATVSCLFTSFSSALTLNSADYPGEFRFNLRSVQGNVDLSPSAPGITCVNLDKDSGGTFYDGTNTYTFNNWNTYCTNSSTVQINTNGYYAYYWYFFGDTIMKEFYPDYTSQQCQTEYNLIPISEVTPNYCALNFNMIDPSECPINSGTGAIIWSNLMINDIPYAQNQNINVFIPDFLAWNIAFNDFNTTIEIEGYNADTEYIEDVIAKENLTPTNEDFGNMLTGIANLFPYLAIAFIMYYLVRLIYKLFK